MTKTEYTINFKFAFDPVHKGAPYTLDGEHYMNGGEFESFLDNWSSYCKDRNIIRIKATSGKMLRWFDERVA